MKRLSVPQLRRWVLVFGTAALAFLSGYVMQARAPDAPMPVQQSQTITLPEAPALVAALRQPPRLSDRIEQTRVQRQESCDPELQLSETPTGQMDIALHAPCHGTAPIAVHVNQLVADETTDAYGRWSAHVPAFESEMRVKVVFDDHVVTEERTFEQAMTQQHVILAWHGVHVFKVRAETPHTPSALSDSSAAPQAEAPDVSVTHVGDGRGAAFEILTFPPNSAGAAGVVRLSVEARVTASNCERDASTEAYQTGYLGKLRLTEIAYTMPDCDRVGEVVRLQNLFRDMRLAER